MSLSRHIAELERRVPMRPDLLKEKIEAALLEIERRTFGSASQELGAFPTTRRATR